MEPQILEQEDLTRLERARTRARLLAHAVRHELDPLAQERLEPLGDRTQRVLGRDVAPGPPEVGGEHDRGARLERQLDRRHDRTQPRLVAEPAAGDRRVEVGAEEETLAPQVEPLDRQLGQLRASCR